MSLVARPLDYWWLAVGASLVVLSALMAWRSLALPQGQARGGQLTLGLTLDTALVVLAVGIALRWARIGHGPFLNLFEILASSLLSLGVAWRIACWKLPVLRDSQAVVLSVLTVLAAWLLYADPVDTHLPPTYEMPVLWVHVALGKVFLGCALVGTGLAGVILARAVPRGARLFARMPSDTLLDALAWRFMLAALVFESLMLVAGAVWAQDAWGRFWAWDPLETWAFVTWLALAASVHARLAWRLGPRASAAMISGVFVIAFLTFFGVPFISTAPHKGAI